MILDVVGEGVEFIPITLESRELKVQAVSRKFSIQLFFVNVGVVLGFSKLVVNFPVVVFKVVMVVFVCFGIVNSVLCVGLCVGLGHISSPNVFAILVFDSVGVYVVFVVGGVGGEAGEVLEVNVV